MNTRDLFEFKALDCPVCGCGDKRTVGYRGGDAHHGGEGLKTTIVRCLACTHQYPSPMPFPKASLGEIYGNAAEYFERHELEEKKKTGKKLIEGFEERLGRKGDFLDVGCGRGELIWAAKDAGWNYSGVDPSGNFIEFGRKNLGVEGKVGTIKDANFPSASFDAVAMGGIIEHLYDPVEVLSEIYRLLRPNGWLYFDAPNEDGLYMYAGNLYMRLLGKDWVVVLAPTFSPFHVQGFNPLSLRRIVERCDFVIREFRVFGEISPQTGDSSFRKTAEYQFGKLINFVGKLLGKGIYMEVWAQKREV